jgi:hypothetical protein
MRKIQNQMFRHIDLDDEDTSEEVKTRLRRKRRTSSQQLKQISSIKNLPMEPY